MSDERLTNLEGRFAWLERHALEQDKAVAELGEEIRRLRRDIAALQQRLRFVAEGDAEAEPEEPPPPHY